MLEAFSFEPAAVEATATCPGRVWAGRVRLRGSSTLPDAQIGVGNLPTSGVMGASRSVILRDDEGDGIVTVVAYAQ
jgi:hypothetical protein